MAGLHTAMVANDGSFAQGMCAHGMFTVNGGALEVEKAKGWFQRRTRKCSCCKYNQDGRSSSNYRDDGAVNREGRNTNASWPSPSHIPIQH
jgi:hypothetical protein